MHHPEPLSTTIANEPHITPDAPNYAAEINQLRQMEFAYTKEPIFRMIGTIVAGVLIAAYTGWWAVMIWPIYFVISLLLHYRFILSCDDVVTRAQVIISALLFGNLQFSFGCLPVLLFLDERPELVLVGSSLLGAQLLYLVRRSDPLVEYNVVQASILGLGSIYVYLEYWPTLHSPLAIIGTALALGAMNFYFIQGLRVARRLRLSREEASRHSIQSKKMAAIGQLAGGVAHDFNNNLTAIIGSLELAKQSDDRDERTVDIDNALFAARQAATTVKHLMIFARKEKPQTAEIEVASVFCELRTLTARLIPASVAFTIKPHDPDLSILADRSQLLAGLINLVVNAIDAMPQGGEITLSAQKETYDNPQRLLDGSSLPSGRFVRLSVKDTGQGIPESIMQNVLDPFFTTKPVGKGTGLGLSMVSGMMQELGGGLGIKSCKPGTRVCLFFPQMKGGVESPEAAPERRTETGPDVGPDAASDVGPDVDTGKRPQLAP